MPKFRNISGETLLVGRTDGQAVGPDQLFHSDGDVSETDDAYLVGDDDDVRAWPKSTWALVGKVPVKPSRSAPKPEWVAYATKAGLPDADSLTKDELVEMYHTEGGN